MDPSTNSNAGSGRGVTGIQDFLLYVLLCLVLLNVTLNEKV